MKKLTGPINVYRDRRSERALIGATGDEAGGLFRVPSATTGEQLIVVAGSGLGWDHVSVSLRNRVPTWAEMEQIKRLFFEPGETAMQLHVPPSEHINLHQHALHLWRPNDGREIPRPPAEMV